MENLKKPEQDTDTTEDGVYRPRAAQASICRQVDPLTQLELGEMLERVTAGIHVAPAHAE